MIELTWRLEDDALFANCADREYIICRRIVRKGVKYFAWCNMRGCFFDERGPFDYDDKASRKAALEELKESCANDAYTGGFGKWNA